MISNSADSLQGYNLYSYCCNNPVKLADHSGNWPQWIVNAANWIDNNIVQPVSRFLSDISEDVSNYNKDNDDIETTYDSNYFSSYNGTLVIRHSSDRLTSWAIGGTIFLNHNLDNYSISTKTNMLKHEYGHILQERSYGTAKYALIVAVPSVTFNFISRENQSAADNYYNMPWEYDADVRGKVNRPHTAWAQPFSAVYFGILG